MSQLYVLTKIVKNLKNNKNSYLSLNSDFLSYLRSKQFNNR